MQQYEIEFKKDVSFYKKLYSFTLYYRNNLNRLINLIIQDNKEDLHYCEFLKTKITKTNHP